MRSKTVNQIHNMIDYCSFTTDENFSDFVESNDSEIKEAHRFVKNINKLTQSYMFLSELQLFIKENIQGVSFKKDNSIVKTLIHDKLGEFCEFNNDSITIGKRNINYSNENLEDLVISITNDLIKYSLLKEKINNLALGLTLNKKIINFLYNIHLNTDFGQPEELKVILKNKISLEKIVLFWNDTFNASISFYPEEDEVYYEYFDSFGTKKTFFGYCLIENIPSEFWNYIQNK